MAIPKWITNLEDKGAQARALVAYADYENAKERAKKERDAGYAGVETRYSLALIDAREAFDEVKEDLAGEGTNVQRMERKHS